MAEGNLTDDDLLLEENVRKLMDRHKQYRKRQIIEKGFDGNNALLQKYDTCRALALKLRSRVSEEKTKHRSPSPATERLIREEIPETTIISSPKRGKIRPRSAPMNRSRKETYSKSTNNLHDVTRTGYLEMRSPPRNPYPTSTTAAVPRGFDSQQPLGANTLTHDEWWLLAQKSKKKKNHKDLSKSHSQPEISQKEMKKHLKKTRTNKPKRPPPSAYLAEHREKEDRHIKEIAITVMEEAYLMESRAYGCVDEANAYAKALGVKKRYSIYTRNENQDSKQHFLRTKSSLNDLLAAQKTLQDTQQLQETQQHPPPAALTGTGTAQEFYHKHITEIMRGCGSRLEKMCIEVMGVPGEPTQLISLDKFYAEHSQLQLEIRKRRNLMTKTERKANVSIENNEINRQMGGESGSGMGSGGKKRAQTIFQSTARLDPSDLALLQESGNGKKKSGRGGGGGKDRERRREEKVSEEALLKILEDTKEVTKILEDQLKELKLRGWNQSIL